MYLNEPSFSSVNLQKSDYTFTTGTAHSLLSKLDARKNFGFNILKMCFVQLLAKTIKLIEIMKKK